MNLEDILIKPDSTIIDALRAIDKGAMKIAFVVDKNNKLLGSISDGDIRRALLKDKNLHDSINEIYNKKPFFVYDDFSRNDLIQTCIEKKIYNIPIVDKNKKIVKVITFDELVKSKKYPNKVILMLGGLGTRLRPLTENMPKPMLKVGGKPILETIIKQFKKHGFENFVFCVNYKAEIIKDYFKDGKDFEINIEYVYEDKKMGTAGALSLLKKRLKEPFFVMNGDLLTTVNFTYMLKYHLENRAVATMGVREYEYQVPFGVVNTIGNEIFSIEEKPKQKFFVSAGIYVLNPETIDYIPKNEYYDMPSLFEKLIQEKKNAITFPIKEYWCDIGRIEEFKKANEDYKRIFDE